MGISEEKEKLELFFSSEVSSLAIPKSIGTIYLLDLHVDSSIINMHVY